MPDPGKQSTLALRVSGLFIEPLKVSLFGRKTQSPIPILRHVRFPCPNTEPGAPNRGLGSAVPAANSNMQIPVALRVGRGGQDQNGLGSICCGPMN